MNQIRIVICGLRFGKLYLESLLANEKFYEIIGILGKEGGQSSEIAKFNNIPLYTSVDQLPANIDLACVILRAGVLGGEGINISTELLQKGISVLHEQPVHYKELVECYSIAKRNKIFFGVANFYKYIPSTKKYVNLAILLSKEEKIQYITIECGHQVLYSVIGILLEIVDYKRPFNIEEIIKCKGPFDIVNCRIGSISCIFKIHNEIDSKDPDNFFYLLYRIQVGYCSGELVLEDPSGPILWYSRIFIPHEFKFEEFSKEHHSNIKIISKGNSYSNIFQKEWTKAIVDQIKTMRKMTENSILIDSYMQKELYQSKQWQIITELIGYPREKSFSSEFLIKNKLQEYEFIVNIKDCDFKSLFTSLTEDKIQEKKKKLDRACMLSMIYTLNENRKIMAGDCIEYNAMYRLANTKKDNRYIVNRWLRSLVRKGMVQQKKNAIISNISIYDEDIEKAWNEARESWIGYLSDNLVIDYYYRNAKHLLPLLKGELNATYLLFPEGKIDSAIDFYTNTIIGRYLNFAISEIIKCYASSNMTLLELGAGTGATSDLVLSNMPYGINYIYTDISTFFLKLAKERFSNFSNIKYKILDIDKSFQKQGIQKETIDIVIAAGMLNNAKDTIFTIQSIKNILKTGGYLLIAEPVADLLELQISQVFMMTKPVDAREENNQTFFNEHQWANILNEQGFELLEILPDQSNMLHILQQKLFIGRKK